MTTPQTPQLDWLLQDFVDQTPGVGSGLLASREGLALSLAGLTDDEADKMAAMLSGLYSLSRGIGRIKGDGGGVRQLCIEGDAVNLFLMSAGDGLPQGVRQPLSVGSDMVGTVLGVLTVPDADAGVVGFGMATLVKSVAEHLVIPTRRGTTHLVEGQ